MSRKVIDFKSEAYYDLFEDWELIEASFLKQYGIRLRQDDDMTWQEFCSLLSGIMHDTPLGMVVAIRAEKNPKVIMNFTPEQKRIRNEWLRRRSQKLKEDPEKYKEFWANFQAWAKTAFEKGGAQCRQQ
mgnify:CR=1 FL=1